MKHLGSVVLKTKRLILRPIRPEDWEEIFYGIRNQKDFLYYTNRKRGTKQQQKQGLMNISEKYKNLNYYNWVITLKNTNKIIGIISMDTYEVDEILQFSYAIDEKYWGNGYAPEALECITNFALKKIKIPRIQGGCVVENTKSKRVMEKCGYKFEGILRKYIKLKDGMHDMFLYALTQDDIK